MHVEDINFPTNIMYSNPTYRFTYQFLHEDIFHSLFESCSLRANTQITHKLKTCTKGTWKPAVLRTQWPNRYTKQPQPPPSTLTVTLNFYRYVDSSCVRKHHHCRFWNLTFFHFCLQRSMPSCPKFEHFSSTLTTFAKVSLLPEVTPFVALALAVC